MITNSKIINKKLKQNFDLILASNSAIRKKILLDLGLEFKVIKPDFDEEKAKKKISNLTIKDQALYLARNKALSISKKYPNSIIIASDQICQIENKKENKLKNNIISKSKNQKEAIAQLQKISGKIHYQNNAVCLYFGKSALIEHFERAKLKMRKLSLEEITSYVDADESWGCAGSYKFESLGRYLFSDIKGNFDCILGMAMQKIINFLYIKNLIKY